MRSSPVSATTKLVSCSLNVWTFPVVGLTRSWTTMLDPVVATQGAKAQLAGVSSKPKTFVTGS